eukprot:5937084-Prymnesium_polylepis.1
MIERAFPQLGTVIAAQQRHQPPLPVVSVLLQHGTGQSQGERQTTTQIDCLDRRGWHWLVGRQPDIACTEQQMQRFVLR